jgi:uncharacterized protein (DUF983 family)
MNMARRRLGAILLLRCSHCLQGRVFYGLFKMRERCPVCGIQFEREQGYFTMAIFIGYCFYWVLLIPLAYGLYLLGLPLWQLMAIIIFLSIVLIPPVFHYARVVWLHIDEILSPHP